MNPSETVQAAQRLLAELVEAAQPAFITSESCGPTAEYRHIFKFRTLAELQAFGRAWSAVASMQPSPAAAPEDVERAAYLERWREAPEWAEWLSEDGDGDCAWWEREPFMNDPVNLRIWNLYTGKAAWANRCLLGSVRCEPRPRQGEGL